MPSAGENGATLAYKLRVVIADDHELFRNGVVGTLNAADGMEVVGEADSASDVFQLADQLMPDIVLLDVNMPGGGIAAAQRIVTDFPLMSVAMLTVSESEDDVNSALDSGACAYILKGVGGKELVSAVRKIGIGETYITPSLAATMLSKARQQALEDNDAGRLFSTLKHREEQILRLVAHGLSNREIGSDLGISEKTVKHYMTNVLQKLQVRNRVEAAILAHEHLDTLP